MTQKLIQKPERLKPYKVIPPYQTINQIRNILEKLDVFTTEKHFHQEPNAGLFNCWVTLENMGLGKLEIGTGGKGLDSQFSLASAYAEFMERLQNNLLHIFYRPKYAVRQHLEHHAKGTAFKRMIEEKNLVLDFELAPDEKLMSREELVDISYTAMKQLCGENTREELLTYLEQNSWIGDPINCLPYYNVKEEKVTYLPIELVLTFCATNAMCAGNTRQEALIHGISEAFERYVLQELYFNKLTPPTVSHEIFADTDIYQRIKSLEEKRNLSVIIKDCSLGKGIPVIGVLFIDHQQNTYKFNLGGDPSPITALERCLTEWNQQGTTVRDKFMRLHLHEDPFAPMDGMTREQVCAMNYLYIDIMDKGKSPNHLLSPGESYPFQGFEHPVTSSNKADLDFLVKKVFDLGFDLYTRDVSFLGFPAFQIYIPGLSETYKKRKKYLTRFRSEIDKNKSVLRNLNQATIEQIHSFAHAFDKSLSPGPDYPLFLPFNIQIQFPFSSITDPAIKGLTTQLLLAQLFFRINDFEKTFSYLNKHIKHIEAGGAPPDLYLCCWRDCIKLQLDGYSPAQVKKTLYMCYHRELADRVIKVCSEPEKIFENPKLPRCFHCDQCELINTCLYFDVLKLIKKLQTQYQANPIDQSSVSKIIAD